MQRQTTWRRWTGTQSELADAIDVAIEHVKGKSEDEPRSTVDISLPPYTFDDGGTAELRQLGRAELAKVKSVSARIYGDNLHVSLRAWQISPAVTLDVDGSDRTVVDGISSQVARVLDRGKPRIPWLTRDGAYLLGAGVGIVLAVLFGLLFTHRRVSHGHRVNEISGWALAGSGLILLASVLSTYWLIPNLEILPADRASRLKRARTAGAAAIGFAAAVLAIALAIRHH